MASQIVATLPDGRSGVKPMAAVRFCGRSGRKPRFSLKFWRPHKSDSPWGPHTLPQNSYDRLKTHKHYPRCCPPTMDFAESFRGTHNFLVCPNSYHLILHTSGGIIRQLHRLPRGL